LSVDPQIVEVDKEQRILIRKCNSFEEFDACVVLQVEVWGYPDGDVIPRRVFTVAHRVGGQVIGAFALDQTGGISDAAGKLVGFAMSFPGIQPADADNRPELFLHSHMLAVSPGYRNDGIGRKLKLFQREEALSRGIQRMDWTFDPLEIKNSFLNIHRLGAIVRNLTPNFYGVFSSRLQAGLPSDRLHAEWYMSSKRVNAILDGSSYTTPAIRETIVVPAAVSEWKSSEDDFPKAVAAQTEIRQHFQQAFHDGLVVVDFRRDLAGNGIFELAPFEELEHDLL
jgi:predicted GNAT superfamily acetyltransferase